MPDRAATTLWYFAYDSNLGPRTSLERRGMRPLDVAAGVVRDSALVLDLPVDSGERAVAKLSPA